MELKVQRIVPAKGDGATRAFADVSADGILAVHGLRVVEGKNGPFVAMPSSKGSDGKYYEVAHPTTKEAREALNEAVLSAYHKLEADRGEER